MAVQWLSTFAMFGLIWFVQVVHYPLFPRVGEAHFPAYEREHATRTGWVVAPLMLAELGSSVGLLLPALRPPAIPAAEAWCGAALVALIWASTALLQIPLHNHLHAGFDRAAIGRLIHTNWLRTAAWTLRTALVLHWAWLLLRPA